jgi:hypothetical protein
MKYRWVGWVLVCFILGSFAHAQKPARRHPRATPPNFPVDEFSGIFFSDPVSQLQGKPGAKPVVAESDMSPSGKEGDAGPASGQGAWKQWISANSIEDLVKESKSRLDKVVTTPAKFAGGGYTECRKECALLASLMAIISQYPEEIRWKSSAPYARTAFARLAQNCKLGSQPVYNEAKQRQQELQDLLNGAKLSGPAEDIDWSQIAHRETVMQLLEWSLRKKLSPGVSNENNFRDSKEDLVKYAELVGVFGQILQQEGMTDADDKDYTELTRAMVAAAQDVLKGVKSSDAELARSAVSRIDQSCNKCHEAYRE